MVFGHHGLKLGRSVFACEFDGDLVGKLGAERVQELSEAGAGGALDPMGGRPMRGWARTPELASTGRAERVGRTRRGGQGEAARGELTLRP